MKQLTAFMGVCTFAWVFTFLAGAQNAIAQGLSVPPAVDTALESVRHENPSVCAAAASRELFALSRTRITDTLRYNAAQDTVPARAKHVALACLDHFPLATTPQRELFDVARIAFFASRDALAESALDRWIAGSPSASVRADRLLLAIQEATTARPARMTLARKYDALLDSAGAAAAGPRLLAAMAFHRQAVRTFDTRAMLQYSQKVIAVGKTLTPAAREDWSGTLLIGYLALANATALAQGPQAALPVFEEAVATVGAVRPDAQELLETYRARLTRYGGAAPAIQAKYWYPATSATVPTPGTVSLVVFVAPSCQWCQGGYAVLKRLNAEYGSRGLQIVLAARTRGYYRYTVLGSPAKETDTLRSYFLDQLRLPGVLAIQETAFTRDKDERRIDHPDPNVTAYAAVEGQNFCALVDRTGKVYALSEVTADNEALLRGFIERLLASPSNPNVAPGTP